MKKIPSSEEYEHATGVLSQIALDQMPEKSEVKKRAEKDLAERLELDAEKAVEP
jgi:hypothetical protein